MTINRIPIDAGAAGLLDFTPVPRQCNRHDSWTPERQRGFIEALAAHGSVTAAAQAVGMAKEGAYQLRIQDAEGSFRAAWAAALDLGVQRLVDVAIERALDGMPIPMVYKGEVIGERRWYDNSLLKFLIRQHMPDRYGPLRPAPPPKKWERRKIFAEVRGSVIAKIEAIERGRLATEPWNPEKLAAYETLNGADGLRRHKAKLIRYGNPSVADYPEHFAGISPDEAFAGAAGGD